MLKILILSASIGSGHTKAAEAIQLGIRNEELGIDVRVVDFMAREVSTLNWLTKKFYLAALKFIPDLYDRIYKFADGRRVGVSARFLSSASMYLPFARLLKKFQPDVVICTHPFPEAAASLWKFLHAKSAEKFLLAAVLTDYSLHEIWIYGEVDVYFVATEEMRAKLAAHSRAGQKIFATGIPIDEKFSAAQKVTDETRTTILIMGGGLGLGSIEETLAELNRVSLPLKILVVAGQNENLLARLRRMNINHPTGIFGYVTDVDKLMAAADLLITKPGALTMTEAFAAGLPLILHAPIPGPEALNAAYATTHGAAIEVGDKKISAVVEELLSEPARLIEMKINAKKLSKPRAATEIFNRIKKIGSVE
ncbi:MAG: glycosyltransferase [Selenomonadaceae bacterium]|nr:glycosyltransferase [Selenomonadaceae bacterium]